MWYLIDSINVGSTLLLVAGFHSIAMLRVLFQAKAMGRAGMPEHPGYMSATNNGVPVVLATDGWGSWMRKWARNYSIVACVPYVLLLWLAVARWANHRTWVGVVGGVLFFSMLIGAGLWFWWRKRPAPVDEPEPPVVLDHQVMPREPQQTYEMPTEPYNQPYGTYGPDEGL